MDPAPRRSSPSPSEDDARLVERLRARDEAAFRELLRRYHRSMVRLAGAYAKSEAVAEEVAQEAWIGMLKGLDGFEGRSSFKAWLFRIAVNAAKARAAREARHVPISSLGAEDDGEPAVDPSRFAEEGRWVGHWTDPPAPWARPDEQLLSAETRALIAREIDALPPAQRQVITLRDMQEMDADETCEILGVTEANQRVLLHRARSKVRQAIEAHLRGAS
jgi:RNA polymerase sigma-70 factor, ECF subfamily